MAAIDTSILPNPKVPPRYKGLFTPNVAPTKRAYCILFSLFFGIVKVTIGSILYHVIAIHPMSGGHPMHTPSLTLALGLIIIGIITILVTFWVAFRYGFDDGDDNLEDDTKNFVKDDVLNFQYESNTRNLPPA